MAIRLRHPDSRDAGELNSSPGRLWTYWFQQIASLVYLVAGIFLLYQYLTHLDRQIVLITGILFVLYGVYRFFLVRRSSGRQRRAENENL